MDKIAEAVAKALISNKELHKIEDDEAEKFAVLVSIVVKSEKHLRMVFYSGVHNVALKIQEILKKQEKELLAKIKGSSGSEDKDDILN